MALTFQCLMQVTLIIVTMKPIKFIYLWFLFVFNSEKVGGKESAVGSEDPCGLKSLKYAMPLEEEWKDFKFDEGLVSIDFVL